MLAIPLRRLGQLAMLHGELPKAAALIKQSLQHNWDIRDYRGTGACLAALGALSMARAQFERAAELFGVVERVLEFIRTSILPFDQQQYMENRKQLLTELDEKTFAEFWAKAKAMSFEDAVTFALAEK